MRGQVVAVSDLFEQQVGEGRRGLSDREARMPPAFEHHDGAALLAQSERHQRAAEAGPDHRDVRLEAQHRSERHGVRPVPAGTRTAAPGWSGLLEVHALELLASRRQAPGAVGETLEIPQVGEDTAARLGQGRPEGVLEIREARDAKQALAS